MRYRQLNFSVTQDTGNNNIAHIDCNRLMTFYVVPLSQLFFGVNIDRCARRDKLGKKDSRFFDAFDR
jgi:hypothetical protein